VNISGGESIVKKISKVVAVVDVTDATSDISTAVELHLYDQEGSEISTENLSMSMQTVNATVEIYPTKTVPVRYEIIGEAAEGYVTTGEVTYGVTEVEISGRSALLSRISEVVVSGEEISIEGAVESVVLDIDLDDYLVSGTSRVDKASNNGCTTVTVEIVPIIEQEFTLLAKQVSLKNIPEDHFADRTLDTAEFVITVRGAQHLIEGLDSTKFRGTIDVSAWMAENELTKLGKGTVYRIVPEFDLGEDFEVVSVEAIEVAAGIVEE
jgi:YbbR domain-containing protein